MRKLPNSIHSKGEKRDDSNMSRTRPSGFGRVFLQDLFRVTAHLSDNFVFRGVQRAGYKLEPSIVRRHRTSARNQVTSEQHFLRHEEGVIRNFQKYATALPVDFINNASYWDWLALAQHHNAPTRLLDWTWSPLTAAFFTIWQQDEADMEHDAAIWCVSPLRVSRANTAMLSKRHDSFWSICRVSSYLQPGFGPYTLHARKLREMEAVYEARVGKTRAPRVQPFDAHSWLVHDVLRGVDADDRPMPGTLLFMELNHMNNRLAAQSGLFSLMTGGNPVAEDWAAPTSRSKPARSPLVHVLGKAPSRKFESALDCFLSANEVEVDKTPQFVKLVIEKKHRVPLREWLHYVGFTDRTMFPGLDGLGRYLGELFDVESAVGVRRFRDPTKHLFPTLRAPR